MASESLDQIPELKPHEAALRALGFQTKEQVLGVAQAAGDDLSRFLGANITELLANLLPSSLEAETPTPHPLGVALDLIPPPQFAFALPSVAAMAAAAPPLPSSVDLFAQLSPPRDQGQRSTCVAFASLAVVEQRGMSTGNFQDMSEQFLYWNCKQNDGIPTLPGTYVGIAFRVLQSDGCCQEPLWLYDPNIIPGNEAQAPPPAGAQADAATRRITASKALPPTSVVDIKRELAGGRCVAFSIPVFNSWYLNPVVGSTGDISNPIPGETVVGGHAMAMIGYQDSADPGLGGGRFLIRNSWPNWGSASPHGTGYGTIPYSYIAWFGREAYSLV
jgi:hypothetical protein